MSAESFRELVSIDRLGVSLMKMDTGLYLFTSHKTFGAINVFTVLFQFRRCQNLNVCVQYHQTHLLKHLMTIIFLFLDYVRTSSQLTVSMTRLLYTLKSPLNAFRIRTVKMH